MDFTGERFIPGSGTAELHHEHVHRYRFAAQFADGARVLDVGSGEGFGAHLLASAGAVQCTGIDIDPEAVRHARVTHVDPRLMYRVAMATETGVDSGSHDLVTCFEVIEHIDDPVVVVREIKRILAPSGILLMSTPDKVAYNKACGGVANPFHVSEMTYEEFRALLSAHFAHVVILRQQAIVASVVGCGALAGTTMELESTARGDLPVAEFLLAACSNAPLPPLPSSLFIDAGAQGRPMRAELMEQIVAARAQLASYEEDIRALAEALHNADAEVLRLRAMLDA